MHNSDIYERYPRIMDLINSSMDTPIYTIEDGVGEYVSYMSLFGCNVIFEQDNQGFIYLYCANDETLQNMINEAEKYYISLEQE